MDLLLLLAGGADGEDSLGVAKPVFALIAEAVLPPQHGLAQRSLGRVVGQLDLLVEESPQRRPELEKVPAQAGHLPVDRLRAALDQPSEGRLDLEHSLLQRVALQGAFPKASPAF